MKHEMTHLVQMQLVSLQKLSKFKRVLVVFQFNQKLSLKCNIFFYIHNSNHPNVKQLKNAFIISYLLANMCVLGLLAMVAILAAALVRDGASVSVNCIDLRLTEYSSISSNHWLYSEPTDFIHCIALCKIDEYFITYS